MIRKRVADKSSTYHQRSSPIWRSCTNLRTLKQIHALMLINDFNSDRFSIREFIYASAVAIPFAINYAHQVFAHIIEPDLFMWNTMLRGSAQSLKPSMAISLYIQMEKQSVWPPDNYTFPFVLKACTRLSWTNMGYVLHGKVVKHGFESNTFARNSIIHFHANCGDISIASALFDRTAKENVVPWSALTAGYARRGELGVARRLFDEMPVKDLVSWNVMITGYVKQGKMQGARELFDQVPKRDVVTWNAMISGYVLCGSHEQALEMYEEMRQVGEKPDEVTLLSLLTACANLGALDVGERIHVSLFEMGSGLSILPGNALIDMYAKCGSIKKAISVFRGLKEKDVSSWNSIICGLAFHGHSEESIRLFEEMRRMKIKPNEITFVGVLVACSHAGKVEEGRRYFSLIRDEYDIEPNVKHYGCLLDILGRSGLLNEAFDFIETMEVEPNAIAWRTLLGACRIHGNVELGRRAYERLLQLRQDESGDYVLISNIYASLNDWNGAEGVRNLMDDSGVKKEAGCSLVDPK